MAISFVSRCFLQHSQRTPAQSELGLWRLRFTTCSSKPDLLCQVMFTEPVSDRGTWGDTVTHAFAFAFRRRSISSSRESSFDWYRRCQRRLLLGEQSLFVLAQHIWRQSMGLAFEQKGEYLIHQSQGEQNVCRCGVRASDR